MLLAHELVGGGPRLIALVHGMLGSGRNLRGLARRLAERLTGWRALTLDLRNHGDSHGAPAPHGIADCARDLTELFERAGAPDVVIGHSFGAKVALAWAGAAARAPRQVWLLDAPIGAWPGVGTEQSGAAIAAVIAAVGAVPMPVASRAALVEALRERGLPEPVCRWMTTNLREAGDGLTWRFDLAAIPEMLASFEQLDLWPLTEALASRGGTQVLLVRAGRGGRFSEGERARVAEASAHGLVEQLVVPHVGHWLHTEDPEALLALLVPRVAALGDGGPP